MQIFSELVAMGTNFCRHLIWKLVQMSSPSSVMEGCKCLQWLDAAVRLCCIWFSCCLWTSSPFFKSPKLEPLKEDTLASTYKSVSPQDGRERSWSHWAFFILYIDILNCSNQNLADYCTALTETEVFCPVLSSLNDDKSASNWVTLQTGEILFMGSVNVFICDCILIFRSMPSCWFVTLYNYSPLQKRFFGILSSFTGCGRLTCMSSQYGDLLVSQY